MLLEVTGLANSVDIHARVYITYYLVDHYTRPASEQLGTTQQDVIKGMLQSLFNEGMAQPSKKHVTLDDFALEFEHVFAPNLQATIVAQLDEQFFEGRDHANIFLATREEIKLAEEAMDQL